MNIKCKVLGLLFGFVTAISMFGPIGCGNSGASPTPVLSLSQAMALALATFNSYTIVGSACPNGGSNTHEGDNVVFSACAFENYSVSGNFTESLNSQNNTITDYDLSVDSQVVGDFTVTGTVVAGEQNDGSVLEIVGHFDNLTGTMIGGITGGPTEGSIEIGNFVVTSNETLVLSCTISTLTTFINVTCEDLANLCKLNVAEACE